MPVLFIRQDITLMETDAIVNAAKPSLLGGGGVDGAIHRAAGPRLREYCEGFGGCKTGEARITPAFDLKCKYIIHTVGPVWQGGDHGEAELLRSCYRNSLHLAMEHGCDSIAFPMISTGVYGYPKKEAMIEATYEVNRFLLDHEMTVYFVLFDRETVLEDAALIRELREFIDDNYARAHTNERRRERFEDAMLPYSASADAEALNEYVCMDVALIPESRSYSAAPKKKGLRELALPKSLAFPGKKAAKTAPLSCPFPAAETGIAGLEEHIDHLGESFRDMLLRKIDESGMTDAECYTGANQDRRLFNKIKNQPGYHPGKMTVLSFAVSLRLDLAETEELLMKAGYAFSPAEIADVIIRFYIGRRFYNIYAINESLYAYDQAQLGNAVT